MNKIVVFQSFAVILSASAILSGQTVCSTSTLKGPYGLQISGTRPAPSVLSGVQGTPGTTEQVIGVVIQTYDGAGGFTQTDNVKGSLSGITPNRPGTGTYSVNADCTGTFTVQNAGAPPIVNQFVIVDNGQAFLTAVTSPQAVMVISTGRKMSYLVSCPVDTPPTLAAAFDSTTNSEPVLASGTLVVWGQGFTPSGGNTLVFQQVGTADVVFSESDGLYFWDYATGQINATLGGRLAPGAWTLTVRSPCSGTASNSISVTIH